MNELCFTHQILVPDNAEKVRQADGYFDELSDAAVFSFTQDEYDLLRRNGGLFDIFDRRFGTIIDDCEEDRILEADIDKALKYTCEFLSGISDPAECAAVTRVREALQYAKDCSVFCEFVNGLE